MLFHIDKFVHHSVDRRWWRNSVHLRLEEVQSANGHAWAEGRWSYPQTVLTLTTLEIAFIIPHSQ